MSRLNALAALGSILLAAVVGCATLPQPKPVTAAPAPHADEVVFGFGWDCYTTKHGIKVRMNVEAGLCKEKAEVERLIDEVLADAKIRKSALTAFVGTTIIFDSRTFRVGRVHAQGLAWGDMFLVVTDNPTQSPWQVNLKHEMLHAVQWRFKRHMGHDDPRFGIYDQEPH